jgi:hypothetical protein
MREPPPGTMSGQHRQTPIYLPSSGQHEITCGSTPTR